MTSRDASTPVGGTLGRWVDESRTASLLGSVGIDNRLTAMTVTLGAGRSHVERLSTAFERSRLAGIGTTLQRVVTASLVYAWLSEDPEPQVVVVDLHETVVVGPFLHVLETVVHATGRVAAGSGVVRVAEDAATRTTERPLRVASVLAMTAVVSNVAVVATTGRLDAVGLWLRLCLVLVCTAGLRSDASMDDLRDSRPAAILAAILEPPPVDDSDPGSEVTPGTRHERPASDDDERSRHEQP